MTIVSSDKDLMQLVGDRVKLLDPIKDRPIGAAEVQEKFGVGPEKVIDVQALCGDSVDNVPGVPGIGVKTAAELITTYGDLENLLAHAAEEIKQPKRRQSLIDFAGASAAVEKTRDARQERAAARAANEALAVKPLDAEKLLPFLREMEFRALATRMTQRLVGWRRKSPPVERPRAGRSPRSRPSPRRAPMRWSTRSRASTIGSRRRSKRAHVAIWPEASSVAGTRPALAGIALALGAGPCRLRPGRHRRSEAELLALPLMDGNIQPASPLSRTAGEGAERSEAGDGKLTRELTIDKLRPLLRGPRGSQDRPRPQDRGAPAVALRRHDRAL